MDRLESHLPLSDGLSEWHGLQGRAADREARGLLLPVLQGLLPSQIRNTQGDDEDKQIRTAFGTDVSKVNCLNQQPAVQTCNKTQYTKRL